MLKRTEDAAKLLSNILLCANCKERCDELQFLGTVCRHAFCWSCVNIFNKSGQLCCPLCNAMLELTNATSAHIVNNFREGIDSFFNLLTKYRDIVEKQGAPIPTATQKVTKGLEILTNGRRRNVDDFISLTQKAESLEKGDIHRNTPQEENASVNDATIHNENLKKMILPAVPESQKDSPKLYDENKEEGKIKVKPSKALFHFAPLAASTQKKKFEGTPLSRNYIFDRSKGYRQEPVMFLTQEMEIANSEPMAPIETKRKCPEPRPVLSFEFTRNDQQSAVGKENVPVQQTCAPVKFSTPQNKPLRDYVPETLERNAQRKSLTYRKTRYDLIEAVLENNFATVYRLLSEGYDVNETNDTQCTPLYYAAREGYLEICEILVEHGAIINAQCDRICDTPLHIAVQNQHTKVTEYLLSKGASKSVRNLYSKLPWQMSEFDSPVRKLLDRYAGRPIQPHIPAKLPDVFVVFIHGPKDNESKEKKKIIEEKKHDEFSHLARCEENLTADVTHVVVQLKFGYCEADVVFIQAMLRGLTIVTTSWVYDCLKRGELIRDTTGYEVQTIKFRDLDVIHNSCRRYRLDRQQLKPRLLQGCIFYVAASRLKSYGSRIFVQDIIKMAGGDISSKEPKINKDDPPPYYKPDLKTPYFILYEADTKLSQRILSSTELHKVSPLWLFDCLSRHDFLEPY